MVEIKRIKSPKVDVYYNGVLVAKDLTEYELNLLRVSIAENKAEGYSIKTKEGESSKIKSNGNLEDFPRVFGLNGVIIGTLFRIKDPNKIRKKTAISLLNKFIKEHKLEKDEKKPVKYDLKNWFKNPEIVEKFILRKTTENEITLLTYGLELTLNNDGTYILSDPK